MKTETRRGISCKTHLFQEHDYTRIEYKPCPLTLTQLNQQKPFQRSLERLRSYLGT